MLTLSLGKWKKFAGRVIGTIKYDHSPSIPPSLQSWVTMGLIPKLPLSSNRNPTIDGETGQTGKQNPSELGVTVP